MWVVGSTTSRDIVATPNGGTAAIARSSVAPCKSLSAIPRPAGAQIVSTAKTFLGLPYLWGGTSGFGFDSSGFVDGVPPGVADRVLGGWHRAPCRRSVTVVNPAGSASVGLSARALRAQALNDPVVETVSD